MAVQPADLFHDSDGLTGLHLPARCEQGLRKSLVSEEAVQGAIGYWSNEMSTTKRLVFTAATLLAPASAFAQTVAAPPTDFTPVVVAVVGGIFSVIGIVATALINSRMKDTQAATALNAAIGNSLGAMQNAVDAGLRTHPLQATIPGITPALAAGVQYGLDHAGEEAARLGVTPADIADKINARLGLVKMAATVVPAPSVVPVAA